MSTNTHNILKEAISLIDDVNDKLEHLYEQHKAHCIANGGEGLREGYTLENLK